MQDLAVDFVPGERFDGQEHGEIRLATYGLDDDEGELFACDGIEQRLGIEQATCPHHPVGVGVVEHTRFLLAKGDGVVGDAEEGGRSAPYHAQLSIDGAVDLAQEFGLLGRGEGILRGIAPVDLVGGDEAKREGTGE